MISLILLMVTEFALFTGILGLMCSACGFPPAVGHWTDAGGASLLMSGLKIRFARVNLINKLLKPLGLTATDSGTSPGIQLSNGMGKTIICPTIEDVWMQVEIFTGKSVMIR